MLQNISGLTVGRMADTKHYCYILWNNARTHTYAGYTVNPKRRLRQHNGELVGGAKYTSKFGPWSFAFIVSCDTWDNHKALSFEWHLKPHSRKRITSFKPVIERRFDLLCKAFQHPKFAGLDFGIHVAPEVLPHCL